MDWKTEAPRGASVATPRAETTSLTYTQVVDTVIRKLSELEGVVKSGLRCSFMWGFWVGVAVGATVELVAHYIATYFLGR